MKLLGDNYNLSVMVVLEKNSLPNCARLRQTRPYRSADHSKGRADARCLPVAGPAVHSSEAAQGEENRERFGGGAKGSRAVQARGQAARRTASSPEKKTITQEL